MNKNWYLKMSDFMFTLPLAALLLIASHGLVSGVSSKSAESLGQRLQRATAREKTVDNCLALGGVGQGSYSRM